jgi:uncharacterized repeat protein (TIGR01451 family)
MLIPTFPRLAALRGTPRNLFALTVITVFALGANPPGAEAQMTGSAFGEQVTLNVAPVLGSPVQVTSGPLPQVIRSSTSNFSASDELAGAGVSTALTGAIFSSGLLIVTTEASSAPMRVTSSSSIQNPSLQLGVLVPLIGLRADQIRATAQLTGCRQEATATGTTQLLAPSASGTLGLALSIPVDPAPNTVLLNLAGIRLVVNEQIVTQKSGIRSLVVNAVHLSVSTLSVAGIGLLTGDVILGQARAQMDCSAVSPDSVDLGITATTSPQTATAGQPLTYRMTIANNGSLAATGVVLLAVLSDGMKAEAGVSSQGSCTLAPVVCSLRSIPAGESATVRVIARPSKPGIVTSVLAVSSNGPELSSDDNLLTLIIPVQPAGPELIETIGEEPAGPES